MRKTYQVRDSVGFWFCEGEVLMIVMTNSMVFLICVVLCDNVVKSNNVAVILLCF